jgi:hypothetical protein
MVHVDTIVYQLMANSEYEAYNLVDDGHSNDVLVVECCQKEVTALSKLALMLVEAMSWSGLAYRKTPIVQVIRRRLIPEFK